MTPETIIKNNSVLRSAWHRFFIDLNGIAIFPLICFHLLKTLVACVQKQRTTSIKECKLDFVYVEVLSTRTETTVIKELDRNLSINIHDLIVVKQINIQLQ